jgi:protein-S-isoprenylcysteine O-methyltransferase Ste14
MGKHNSGINEVLEGRVFKESPLVGAAAKWSRVSQHFGIPILLIFLFGPPSIQGSESSLALYFAISIPIALGALGIRWWSMGYGREKEFIVNGPYRYVRNPVELSCVLAYTAAAILLRFPGWYTSVVALVGIIHMSFVSISYERNLVIRHGTRYLRYAQRVRRWIPSSVASTNATRPDFDLTFAVFSDLRIWVWLVGYLAVFAIRSHFGSIASW